MIIAIGLLAAFFIFNVFRAVSINSDIYARELANQSRRVTVDSVAAPAREVRRLALEAPNKVRDREIEAAHNAPIVAKAALEAARLVLEEATAALHAAVKLDVEGASPDEARQAIDQNWLEAWEAFNVAWAASFMSPFDGLEAAYRRHKEACEAAQRVEDAAFSVAWDRHERGECQFKWVLAAIVALVVVFALGMEALKAQDLSGLTRQEALNELSSESAQCAAYQAVSNQCVMSMADADQKALLEANALKATAFSYYFGRATGVSEEALDARLQLSLRDIMAKTGKSCLNLSVILLEYAVACKQLLEHPEVRLQVLMMNGGR
jgi:hypothetical protein